MKQISPGLFIKANELDLQESLHKKHGILSMYIFSEKYQAKYFYNFSIQEVLATNNVSVREESKKMTQGRKKS